MTKTSLTLSFSYLLLAYAFTATALAAPEPAGLSLITQAKEHLQSDRFLEALAVAKDAVRADSGDYRCHYYVAMAYLGLEQFDEAEAATKTAFNLALEKEKAGVQKLLTAIRNRRASSENIKAADEALSEGLAAKAARLYAAAWDAAQNNPTAALKAANLYANRLSQPVDAARLLRAVRISFKGSPAADDADKELQKISSDLRKIAVTHLTTALTLEDYKQQVTELEKAEEADPNFVEIHTERAKIVGAKGTAEEMLFALKALAKRELVKVSQLARLPRMKQWLENPDIAEFLTDMLGPKQFAVLKDKVLNPDFGPLPGKTYTITYLGLTLVPLSAGTFTMGSPTSEKGRVTDEREVRVTISKPFWLGKTEVTQAQWEAMMGDNPSNFKGATLPVEQVSWGEAKQFCQQLTMLERFEGRLPSGYTYTLPTEAQWEYACRAGTTEAFAGDLDAMGWYGKNSGNQTHPVGQKKANAWGLYDMHGNVWEWCADWYGDYPSGSSTDPTGAASGSRRVNRGFSCYDENAHWRYAFRRSNSPVNRHENLGFRLALSPTP